MKIKIGRSHELSEFRPSSGRTDFQTAYVEKTGHIWMVVRKMREQLSDGSDGFNFNLNWQAHKGITISIAQFHKIDPFIHGQGADDNPCVATLLAAKDAWTQWTTGSYRRG